MVNEKINSEKCGLVTQKYLSRKNQSSYKLEKIKINFLN